MLRPFLAPGVMMKGFSFTLTAAVVLTGATAGWSVAQESSSLAQLGYLDGRWDAEVTFLGAEGEVDRTESAEGEATFILDGHGMRQFGRLRSGLEVTSWYRVDATTGDIVWSSLSVRGDYDEFRGTFSGDSLVLISHRQSGGRDIRFKRVDWDITPSGHRSRLELSTDRGRSWRVTHRQQNRLVATPQRDSLAIVHLDALIGEWRAQQWLDNANGRYRFGYTLAWMNPQHTVAKMTIKGVREDESSWIIWEGFKGWDPVRRRAFYRAFDTAGRQAEGTVRMLNDSTHLTEYTGLGPTGDPVRIRDESIVTAPGRYRSVTFLLRGDDWVQVGRDEWRRIGDAYERGR